MKTKCAIFVLAAFSGWVTSLHAGPGCSSKSSCSYSASKSATQTASAEYVKTAGGECSKSKAACTSACSSKGKLSGQWSSTTKKATLTLWKNGAFLLSQNGETISGQYAVEKDELVLKSASPADAGKMISSRYRFSEDPANLTLSQSDPEEGQANPVFLGVWSFEDEAPEKIMTSEGEKPSLKS